MVPLEGWLILVVIYFNGLIGEAIVNLNLRHSYGTFQLFDTIKGH